MLIWWLERFSGFVGPRAVGEKSCVMHMLYSQPEILVVLIFLETDCYELVSLPVFCVLMWWQWPWRTMSVWDAKMMLLTII